MIDKSFPTGAIIPSIEVLKRFESSIYRNEVKDIPIEFTKGMTSDAAIDLAGNTDRWPVRNQKRRGTCVAFAVAACVEILLSDHDKRKSKLSPEFLYWWCRQKEYRPAGSLLGYEEGAIKLSQARDVLFERGICKEDLLPYRTGPRYQAYGLSHEAENGPSHDAKKDAIERTMEKGDYWHQLSDGDIVGEKSERIYRELKSGRPVAVGIPMFEFDNHFGTTNWTNLRTQTTGIVLGPTDFGLAKELEISPDGTEGIGLHIVSAHVVCFVGFEPDSKAEGGGWFIFRNSWGYRFGKHRKDDQSVPLVIRRQGYGAISVQHVEGYCWEFLSLRPDSRGVA